MSWRGPRRTPRPAHEAGQARADIQGVLLHGYQHEAAAAFLFLRIVNAARFRVWLRETIPQVTTGAGRHEGSLNLAFTAAGLAALGLPRDALETFPQELLQGMARRAEDLGDTGEAAPERWEIGAQPDEIHLLLMLYAPDEQARERLFARQRARFLGGGLELLFSQRAARLPAEEAAPQGFREHFGFRDGISQPMIEGFEPKRSIPLPDPPIKAGEFILGYRDERGDYPESPSVAAEDDPEDLLAPATDAPERRDLGRNGTYLVLRKLEQDVEAFSGFLDAHAKGPDGRVDKAARDLLAAKMVGRWQNGAPLKEGEERAPEDPPLENDFLFAERDPYGLGCPVTSHIRRANPRDALVPSGKRAARGPPVAPEDRAQSMEITRRHRILRRGIPYDDRRSKGLVFIALGTRIREQFEFVQRNWLNNPKFGVLGSEKDPLVGDNGGSVGGAFSIPGRPVRRCLMGLPRFVVTRGGGYFFLPSMSALRFLAAGGQRA